MTDESEPTLHEMSDVPLGYEPIAEFEEHADAVAHWRIERRLDVTVLLVREGRWFSLWCVRNHIWLS